MTAVRARRVPSADLDLAVTERGDPTRPAVVLIHGYPDTQAVWAPVAENLASRFFVVTYDVRGAGRSQAPGQNSGYAMAHLMADLAAVIEATCGGVPVHLVGHDWGALQGWEAATTDLASRLLSFTAISGPCLDHAAYWVRERLSRPTPRNLADLARQAKRSWYIAALLTPGAAEKLWGNALASRWSAYLERREGVSAGAGHPAPTLAGDGIRGANLYIQNVAHRLAHPRPDPVARVPVQVIIAERDRYLSPSLCGDVGRWVPSLRVVRIDAGHWAIRTHAGVVADHITDMITASPAAGSP